MFEIDHVFVCVDDPSSAERALTDAGVVFARRAVHEGQGTANACASLENAYLELLYAYDDGALRSDAVRPLGLQERLRWRETGTCPFGVALRPTGADGSEVETWPYMAAYLSPGASIPIVTPRGKDDEPLVFLMPSRGSAADGQRGRRLRGARITIPHGVEVSDGTAAMCSKAAVGIVGGREYLLELDCGGSGERDFRPAVPLVVRW